MSNLIRSPGMAGDIVRKARLARCWTQTELASRMNVRQATVSKLEAGEPATQMAVFFDALTALELELNVSPRSAHANFEELF